MAASPSKIRGSLMLREKGKSNIGGQRVAAATHQYTAKQRAPVRNNRGGGGGGERKSTDATAFLSFNSS